MKNRYCIYGIVFLLVFTFTTTVHGRSSKDRQSPKYYLGLITVPFVPVAYVINCPKVYYSTPVKYDRSRKIKQKHRTKTKYRSYHPVYPAETWITQKNK